MLRLLEAVAAHEAFSSPPRTRFSEAVENHLFLTWPEAPAATTPMTGDGKTVARYEMEAVLRSGSSNLNGRSSPGSRALSFLTETNLNSGGALGLFDLTVAGRGGYGDEELVGGALGAAAAAGGGLNDTTAGDVSSAAAGRRAHEVEEGPRREGEPGGGRGARGGGHVLTDPNPELEAFRRVYIGFYKNFVDAKGVPSGFRSCATKAMDEGELCIVESRLWNPCGL